MTRAIQAKRIYCKASSTGADEIFSNCSFTISLLKLWVFNLGSTCSILSRVLLFYSPFFFFFFLIFLAMEKHPVFVVMWTKLSHSDKSVMSQ